MSKFDLGRCEKINTIETLKISDVKATKVVKDEANNVLSVVTFEIIGTASDGAQMTIPVFFTSQVSIKNTLLGILDQAGVSGRYDDTKDREKCAYKDNLPEDANIFLFKYLKKNLIGKEFKYKCTTSATSSFLNYITAPYEVNKEEADI